MYATSFAKLLDRKEKERSSLQWDFSNKAKDVFVPRISDKRDAGVCLQTMETNKPGGDKSHKGDSLPGFFALDIFTGGLLSLAFHGVNIVTVAEAADEIWLDRAKAKPEAQPEPSYFSY